MSTALDSYGPAQGKSATPPQGVVEATAQRRVSEVNRDRDVPEVDHDRRPHLSELVGEWRWQSAPDDREPPRSGTGEDAGSATDHELIRVYLWAQILIG
jgi:hypothetical protein